MGIVKGIGIIIKKILSDKILCPFYLDINFLAKLKLSMILKKSLRKNTYKKNY